MRLVCLRCNTFMAVAALPFDGVIEATSTFFVCHLIARRLGLGVADAFTFEWDLCSDKEKDTSRLPDLEVS
jgi:hypothetical protein